MEQFWSIFWKVFAAAIVVMVIASIAGRIITLSPDFASMLLRQTFAAALGVCGIIGLGVVPVEMYLEDRNRREKTNVIE
jgi:hypothetical protein